MATPNGTVTVGGVTVPTYDFAPLVPKKPRLIDTFKPSEFTARFIDTMKKRNKVLVSLNGKLRLENFSLKLKLKIMVSISTLLFTALIVALIYIAIL